MAKKTYIFNGVLAGWCSLVVEANSLEEAQEAVENGDFEVENEEWDTVVEDLEDYEIIEEDLQ